VDNRFTILEAALDDEEAWGEVRGQVQGRWNEREFGLWEEYLGEDVA
jgi:hypothetical protein